MSLGKFLFEFFLALVLAPLLPGIINRVKARMAGRSGKPLLQTYFDILKLLRKGECLSQSSSWVFTFAPSLNLAAVCLSLALLPLGGLRSPLYFGGDFILAVYLLGLGRFAVMLAALDTGSSFEGMGASREATFSALAEPALFLCFLTLTSLALGLNYPAPGGAFHSGTVFSLSGMLNGEVSMSLGRGRAELLLLPAVFFILLLVENCRIPVDDPNTHLELTMIHEVMVLDNSGPNLAFIVYAAALKLWFFAALVAGLLLPPMPFWQHCLAFLAAIFFLAFLVGLVESLLARLRLNRVPQLLGMASALGALTLILTQAH